MHRLTGIVLKRRNIGSVDRLVTLFSAAGKQEFRARGTQKLASKLAGSLEPLTLVELTVAPSRRSVIIGSVVRESYRSIHENLAKIAAAGLLASAAETLVVGQLDDPVSYRRLREAMALVSRSRTNREVFLGIAYGLWNLLAALGYAALPTGATAAEGRLRLVLLRGQVNLVRRIRCAVATARRSAEGAVAAAERAAERPVPAAPFFWTTLTRR